MNNLKTFLGFFFLLTSSFVYAQQHQAYWVLDQTSTHGWNYFEPVRSWEKAFPLPLREFGSKENTALREAFNQNPFFKNVESRLTGEIIANHVNHTQFIQLIPRPANQSCVRSISNNTENSSNEPMLFMYTSELPKKSAESKTKIITNEVYYYPYQTLFSKTPQTLSQASRLNVKCRIAEVRFEQLSNATSIFGHEKCFIRLQADSCSFEHRPNKTLENLTPSDQENLLQASGDFENFEDLIEKLNGRFLPAENMVPSSLVVRKLYSSN